MLLSSLLISAVTFTVFHPIIVSVPFLVANALITFVLVVGLTYLMLPVLTKLLERWLYPNL